APPVEDRPHLDVDVLGALASEVDVEDPLALLRDARADEGAVLAVAVAGGRIAVRDREAPVVPDPRRPAVVLAIGVVRGDDAVVGIEEDRGALERRELPLELGARSLGPGLGRRRHPGSVATLVAARKASAATNGSLEGSLDDERAHHVVVFVLDDVAVPDVLARAIEAGDEAGDGARIGEHRV